jgi:hypothetical protein
MWKSCCLILALMPMGSAMAVDYFTSVQPSSLAAVMHPGDMRNLDIVVMYANTDLQQVTVTGYVQDDPACPESLSSHTWIPFAVQQYSMPPGGIQGTINYSVPFDATGMGFGSYRTNICIVQSSDATHVVPVLLKVVAPDDIFFDGFD